MILARTQLNRESPGSNRRPSDLLGSEAATSRDQLDEERVGSEHLS